MVAQRCSFNASTKFKNKSQTLRASTAHPPLINESRTLQTWINQGYKMGPKTKFNEPRGKEKISGVGSRLAGLAGLDTIICSY